MSPRRLSSAIALLCLAAPFSASAALVSYTLGAGSASGDLRGDIITVTGFTITATADTSTVVSGTLGGTFPIYYNPVVPTMEIHTTGGTLSFTLPTVGPYSWYAIAGSDDLTSVHGFYLIDSFSDVPLSAAFVTHSSGPYSNLVTVNVYNGTAGGYLINLPSSEGTLNLTPASNPGTFTVTSVPEPATAAATLLSSLAGMLLVSRRRRS